MDNQNQILLIKKLRTNKNPYNNCDLNQIVFLALLFSSMAHSRIPIPNDCLVYTCTRGSLRKNTFMGKMFFFTWALRFWEWGEKKDVCGLWLGLSSGWVLCEEILLSRTFCFQRCSEEAEVVPWIHWTCKVDVIEIWTWSLLSCNCIWAKKTANGHQKKIFQATIP